MIAGDYFVTMWRVGVTVPVGAVGEIANVSQIFHPGGLLAAATIDPRSLSRTIDPPRPP
jgi:hypothetical protein